MKKTVFIVAAVMLSGCANLPNLSGASPKNEISSDQLTKVREASAQGSYDELTHAYDSVVEHVDAEIEAENEFLHAESDMMRQNTETSIKMMMENHEKNAQLSRDVTKFQFCRDLLTSIYDSEPYLENLKSSVLSRGESDSFAASLFGNVGGNSVWQYAKQVGVYEAKVDVFGERGCREYSEFGDVQFLRLEGK